MADVQESYPLPTSGDDVPVTVSLAGAGVSLVKGSVYKVTLAKGANVAVTASTNDVAGDDHTYAGTYNWVSRNAEPRAANAGDQAEGYPVATGALGCVASFNVTEGTKAETSASNPATVYAHELGQALVEVFVPLGDLTGATAAAGAGIYAQLLVTVVA